MLSVKLNVEMIRNAWVSGQKGGSLDITISTFDMKKFCSDNCIVLLFLTGISLIFLLPNSEVSSVMNVSIEKRSGI